LSIRTDPSTVRKKYRTSVRTSEAHFATLVRHYRISAMMPQYSKSRDVGVFLSIRSDPSTVRKNTGHLSGLQKPISLHLLGIIVSRQYSKSSETFCKCTAHFVQIARPDVNHHRKMTVGQFFVDQICDCRVHVWPFRRQRNTGKYRTATKIQEFTGFTSSVFTCNGAVGTPSRTGPLARKYLAGFPYS